ncbi:MAG: site-specific integrase [Actinomycetota bacterium]
MSFARSDRLFPLWRLLAWTGMRRGEALGLKWCDLRTRPDAVAIRRSITIAAGQLHVTVPKSARARVIALDATTARVLRSYRRRQDRLLLEENLAPTGQEDWIFHVQRQPMNPNHVSKYFPRLVERSGLPKIRLHDLRHTHASHLILAGANIKAVQERLGHSDIVHAQHLLPPAPNDPAGGSCIPVSLLCAAHLARWVLAALRGRVDWSACPTLGRNPDHRRFRTAVAGALASRRLESDQPRKRVDGQE